MTAAWPDYAPLAADRYALSWRAAVARRPFDDGLAAQRRTGGLDVRVRTVTALLDSDADLERFRTWAFDRAAEGDPILLADAPDGESRECRIVGGRAGVECRAVVRGGRRRWEARLTLESLETEDEACLAWGGLPVRWAALPICWGGYVFSRDLEFEPGNRGMIFEAGAENAPWGLPAPVGEEGAHYSISPALPAGLTLGGPWIGGTPALPAPAADYELAAVDAAGRRGSATVRIGVAGTGQTAWGGLPLAWGRREAVWGGRFELALRAQLTVKNGNPDVVSRVNAAIPADWQAPPRETNARFADFSIRGGRPDLLSIRITSDENPGRNPPGPSLTDEIERRLVIALVPRDGGDPLLVRGPGAPGTRTTDDDDPYYWRPANAAQALAWAAAEAARAGEVDTVLSLAPEAPDA